MNIIKDNLKIFELEEVKEELYKDNKMIGKYGGTNYLYIHYFQTYDNVTLAIYNELLKPNFYVDGIINCPYIENGSIVDYLTLIPKIPSEIV